MMTEDMDSLVDGEWLAARLRAPDLRVLACGFDLPGSEGAARNAFLAGRIPGAAYFDIEEVADQESPLPHMLPSPERFARLMGALGIGDKDRVVVYDSLGLAAATRAWFSFRVFGHPNVAVLDGGLTLWRQAGRAIETGAPRQLPRARFTPRFEPALVRSRAEVAALQGSGTILLDARAAPRFEGTAPETWPGRRSGHIPGSRNLDHTRLWDQSTRRLLPEPALRAAFGAVGASADTMVVTSCGSGITATVLAFALDRLGRRFAVYDGSWAEWGLPDGPPVETGPAR